MCKGPGTGRSRTACQKDMKEGCGESWDRPMWPWGPALCPGVRAPPAAWGGPVFCSLWQGTQGAPGVQRGELARILSFGSRVKPPTPLLRSLVSCFGETTSRCGASLRPDTPGTTLLPCLAEPSPEERGGGGGGPVRTLTLLLFHTGMWPWTGHSLPTNEAGCTFKAVRGIQQSQGPASPRTG